MDKLVIISNSTKVYINDKTEMRQPKCNGYSGNWKLEGLALVKRGRVKDIVYAWDIENQIERIKEGIHAKKEKWHVMDFDYGASRIWGNPLTNIYKHSGIN